MLQPIDPDLIFKKADTQSMAEKIEKFLKTPNQILTLKLKWRENALANYDWGLSVNRIEEEFDLIRKNK